MSTGPLGCWDGPRGSHDVHLSCLRVGADPPLSLRYINHSCAPNCVAEVVTFDKEDKIIIISSRRIPKGEEVSEGLRGCSGGPGGPREGGWRWQG